MTDKLKVVDSNTNEGISIIIDSFEKAEAIAEYIAKSTTYNKAFLEVPEGEDKTPIPNKSAIVTCLMLGAELGFKPIESVMMGRRLNQEAVMKVHLGTEFGLSSIQAMQHIHIFSSGGRELIVTDIHVINKVLTDAKIKRVILDDGSKPFYIYRHHSTKELIDYDPDLHVIANKDAIPRSQLEAGLSAGKLAVLRTTTKRALVQLTRGDEVIAIPYTLIQATDAGLYQGINSITGEEVKGKANWNSHPETHLIKQSITLGARIIASDRINGMYEADEFVKTPGANDHYTDAEFVEE